MALDDYGPRFYGYHDAGAVDWGANKCNPNLVQSASGFAVPEIPAAYAAASLSDQQLEPGSSLDQVLHQYDACSNLDLLLPAHPEWTRQDGQHQELPMGPETIPAKCFQQWTNFQLQHPFDDLLQHHKFPQCYDINQSHELADIRTYPQPVMAPPSSHQFLSTDYPWWRTILPEQPTQSQQQSTLNLAPGPGLAAAAHGSNLYRWHGKEVPTLQRHSIDTCHPSNQTNHNGRVSKIGKSRRDHLRAAVKRHTFQRLLTKNHMQHNGSSTTGLPAMTYRKFDIRGHVVVLGVSSRDNQNCIQIEMDINGRAKRWVQDMSQFGPRLYETFEEA